MFAIVPDSLRDAINAALDKALDGRPCDADSRAVLYDQLLCYFDEHGVIPDFALTPTELTKEAT
jgi:hypothetical protein